MVSRQIIEQIELLWLHVRVGEFDLDFIETHADHLAELTKEMRSSHKARSDVVCVEHVSDNIPHE